MKRFVYREGKVLQVRAGPDTYGYCYAVHKDLSFGVMFLVVDRVFSAPLDLDQVASLVDEPSTCAYINTAGFAVCARRSPYEWEHVGCLKFGSAPMPTWFYGSEHTFMTVVHPDGRQERIPGPHVLSRFEDEMIAKGYVQKVLWLPEDIGDYIFERRPLRFSAHLRY